ncbi:MAG: c-type cytochrome biogenesis protein CcmI [Xanthobacteraceae bacterium]
MTLWFLFALMTALAVFAVLWPLGRSREPAPSGSDVAVYRDQLQEIERDQAAGLIPEQEAQAARVEVSRRLLSAVDAVEAETVTSRSAALWRRRAVALVALVALPVVAGSLYLSLGSPGLPGQPLAKRVTNPHANQSIDSLVAQVEDRLAQNPQDGRGWELLAPIYLRMGRFDDAVHARRNALALNGENAARQADLGEALTAAANGVVTAEAKGAFARAAELNPQAVKPRFFLGLAAEQDGQREQAASIWRALIGQAPADAPWLELVRAALARVDPTAAPPGPSAADVAAASALGEGQRQEMIRGMVERLAQRLKQDGSDGDGWLRLVRAYMVLGEPDRARAAVVDARHALGNDPVNLRRVDDLVKELGLEG